MPGRNKGFLLGGAKSGEGIGRHVHARVMPEAGERLGLPMQAKKSSSDKCRLLLEEAACSLSRAFFWSEGGWAGWLAADFFISALETPLTLMVIFISLAYLVTFFIFSGLYWAAYTCVGLPTYPSPSIDPFFPFHLFHACFCVFVVVAPPPFFGSRRIELVMRQCVNVCVSCTGRVS